VEGSGRDVIEVLFRHWPGETEEATRIFKIVGVPAEIRTDHLHNISPDITASPNIIRMIKSRKMRWVGHVARMGEKRNAYRILVGKQEGKRPLGR
jgi:hypothetical protein